MPAAAKAPLLDAAGKAAKQVSLDEAVFAAEVKPHLVHEAVRAELNAQSRRHPRSEEPRPRLRRPREAVAPEGHRPRTRGHDPRAALDGRRRRLPSAAMRGYRGQGESRRRRRAALRGALWLPMRQEGTLRASSTESSVRRAVDEEARSRSSPPGASELPLAASSPSATRT